MKSTPRGALVSRRDWLARAGLASGGAGLALNVPLPASAQAAVDKANRGGAPIKITKVRAITTAPRRIRLTVVKVETSEPGLYGLGCATYNQRTLPVVSAIQDYLDPFARGRDADNIEDLWQNAYTSSYWRNGPVLNCAMCGLEMALWDIKGKRAKIGRAHV